MELLDEKGENCGEESFLRMGIVGCLEQIIQRLKNDENTGKSKNPVIKNCGQLEQYAENNGMTNVQGIVEIDSTKKMERENLDDFKVFSDFLLGIKVF